MRPLSPEEVWDLEGYETRRDAFRRAVIALKKVRRVPVGEHLTLVFENRSTLLFQIQEMLRVERIYEKAGIEEELAAYNPLIPDGTNLKATFMLEYEDADERRRQLAMLIGIEDRVWVRVGDGERIFAIADEDMDREDENKTSSVHFLRFELEPEDVKQAKSGADIQVGIDHENYRESVDPLPPSVRDALVADLN